MNEYLMIAHEMEKARLLARKARKDHHRKGEKNRKIVAQTIHHTIEEKPQ